MRLRIVLASLLAASSAFAAAPPAGPDPAEVARLVKRLDHDSFDARQAADERLRSMGKPAVPLLREEAARTRSLEARARLGRVLRDLTIDERLGALLAQLNGDEKSRAQAVYALRQAGPEVVPLLRREVTPGMPPEARQRVEAVIAELSAGGRR